MTVHWIDHDWISHSIPLGCFLHTGKSDAENLLDDFAIKIFTDCGFDELDVCAIVSDTTGNMNKFGELLDDLHILHIYCTDHVLQLTAKKAFFESKNEYDGHEGMMIKARALIEHASRSPSFCEKLLSAQRNMPEYNGTIPKRVLVDVKTRWWSTYQSLERLFYLKNAFRYMVITGGVEDEMIFDDNEWQMIEDIVTFLKPFMKVMKKLEGEQYVTISLVPSLIAFLRKSIKDAVEQHNVRLNERTRTRNFLEWLIRNIHTDFEERWGTHDEPKFSREVQRGKYKRQKGIHFIIAVATALDPRYKGLRCYSANDRNEIWDSVLTHAIDISVSLSIYSEDDNGNRVVTNENRVDVEDNENDELAMFMNDMNDNSNGEFGEIGNNNENDFENGDNNADENANADDNLHRTMCEREVTEYRNMTMLALQTNGKYNCPLIDFWKVNEQKFPVLSKMAKMYLAVPATSAPSERLFSSISRNISKSRNRLDPEIAGMQVFISKVIKWYREQTE